jgi:restriction system protein
VSSSCRALAGEASAPTREAKYGPDRSNVPVVLWALEDLTKALVDNYEQTDTETRALVALRDFYVPAG